MGFRFVRAIYSLVFPHYFSIFNWQYARILLEQLGKAAGVGIADHLGDLTHGKVGLLFATNGQTEVQAIAEKSVYMYDIFG